MVINSNHRKKLRYGKSGISWVDLSFGDTLEDVKRKLENVGIPHPSDRQASGVIAKMFDELEFDIQRKNKKRRNKLEITFK